MRIPVRSCVGGMLAAVAIAPAIQAEDVVESGIDTEYETVELVRVAEGFEHPWSVTFLPGGGYLITERPGRLQRVSGDEVTEISGAPEVHTGGQGGLLDVVLHPDYDDNGWIYLTYSLGDAEATSTALARARAGG